MKIFSTTLMILIYISQTLTALSLSGQDRIDSLESTLPNAKKDSNYVRVLNSLAYHYVNINPNKSLDLAKQALTLSKKLKSDYSIASSYNILGLVYDIKSDYPSSLNYYYKALEIIKELNKKEAVAVLLGNIGLIYSNQGDTTRAVDYYNKAMTYSEETSYSRGVCLALSNLANHYKSYKKFDLSIDYHNRAIQKAIEIADVEFEANLLASLGSLFTDRKEYQKAENNLNKALQTYIKLNNKKGIAQIKTAIGDLYLSKSKDSISTSGKELTGVYSNLENTYLNLALSSYKEAFDGFKELEILSGLFEVSLKLSNIYEEKEDYKKHSKMLKYHMEVKDSIYNLEKNSEINALTYKVENIEEEIAQREMLQKNQQRNRLQYLGIGSVVVAFGILLLLMGKMKLSEWKARALVFLTFIFLFEFILVIIDPFTDEYSEGIPLIKFAINMGLALIIFPMHQYFEKRVSLKVVKPDSLNTEQILEEFRKRKAEENSQNT